MSGLRGYLCRIAFVAMCALPATGYAQQASLAGAVTDSTGGALPGVTVTLTATAGAERSEVTGDGGRYEFTAVTPGVYTIRAALSGSMATTERKSAIALSRSFSFS